jgi:P27 family predicted phage terminase small subunit
VGLPDNVHALRGTTPNANRGTEKSVPVVLAPGAPEPPEVLAGEALAEWNRVVPVLDADGLLSKIDRAILVTYCSAWAVLVQCTEHLPSGSMVAKGDKTNVKAPEFMAWRDASTLVQSLAKELFATPVARLRTRRPEAPDAESEGAGILD